VGSTNGTANSSRADSIKSGSRSGVEPLCPLPAARTPTDWAVYAQPLPAPVVGVFSFLAVLVLAALFDVACLPLELAADMKG
jgi:hypothetical protein